MIIIVVVINNKYELFNVSPIIMWIAYDSLIK